jgi:two-component sensor histidine kinase
MPVEGQTMHLVFTANGRRADSRRDALRSLGIAMNAQREETLPGLELIVREINHRINNELSSAISMIARAASRCAHAEAKAALGGVKTHLEHYARVQRALQMPEPGVPTDVSTYLRQLSQSISLSKLSDRNIELMFVECPMVMASERCWLLGMIVHELITNSARHAFADAGGKIRVELSRHHGVAQCIVMDNGAAAPAGRSGQGLKIIRHLAESLDGTLHQKIGAKGSVSAVVFPANP